MDESVAPGVWRVRTLIANVYFVEQDDRWVLIDAGVWGTTGQIKRAAAKRFGAGSRPAAILLTHGHFDHVGGLPQLADEWNVPIYAHPLELPYLTGRSAYAPPDPSVGGGGIAWMCPLFPRGPYHFGSRVRLLAEDGAVPMLREWRWIHTAGHTAGHVSFFREADRTLIAGDAVVATRQESITAALFQIPQVWRPPAYYTPDWNAARRAVEQLAALEPECLATGHGPTLRGAAMRQALHHLARNFERIRPSAGRYVDHPAIADERGVVGIPAANGAVVWQRAASIAAVGIAAIWIARSLRSRVSGTR